MIVYQNFNSSVPYNLDVREYEDYSYIPHLHRDFELIYVKEGEVTVSIESEAFRVREGDAALILQNEVHSFLSEAHSRIWIAVFSEDYVRDFAAEIKLRKAVSHIIELSPGDRRFLLENLIFGDKERYLTSACLSFVCSLFLRRCTALRSISDKKSVRNDLIHGILNYINEHYRENIRLGDVAAALGYEEHYVSRIFNKYFSTSFTFLVNEYRIYYARALMRNDPSLTLAQVAFESGFGSVRNFNRAYLSIVGNPPKRVASRRK